MYIAPVENDFLINVAAAAPSHPALDAVVEILKGLPRFRTATEDHVEMFDEALELAEA